MMSEVPPPDWAALYQQHRHAMYRVAARVLREAGRADEAGDAVTTAMESLIKSPPANVQNWQAVLVTAAKRRALDLLGSAAVRHEVATDESRGLDSAVDGLANDVAEHVDRQRAGAVAWEKLALLDIRHRKVVWEYVALGRPRQQVAAELGVTPGRVSQMAKEALRILREALKSEGVRR
jgi:RNA polymerase sigma-70 factor (ECF subfamily)